MAMSAAALFLIGFIAFIAGAASIYAIAEHLRRLRSARPDSDNTRSI